MLGSDPQYIEKMSNDLMIPMCRRRDVFVTELDA